MNTCGVTRIAALTVLGCILSVGARAQDNDGCKSDGPKDSNKPFCISEKDVRSFEPSLPQRFLRAWQYQFDLEEQPGFLLATANGSAQIVQNPEKYLKQDTITFQFSELFPNPANLASIVGGIYTSSAAPDKDKSQVRLDRRLCGSPNTLDCLASGGSGFGNFMERFLSSTTVKFSLSERNPIQQGILLPGLPASLHYGPAGEVDFDPASLFITGTSWKDAAGALKGMSNSSTLALNGKEKRCFVKVVDNPTPPSQGQIGYNPASCATYFAGARFAASLKHQNWTYLGALLIPKFQFKAVSQFDYIKNGGVLVSFPGLQRSLKNYSLIWDFRRSIPSTADRVKVLSAYQTYSPPPEKLTGSKLCVTVDGGSRGYVPVPDTFNSDGCRTLAKNVGAKAYALACATSSTVKIGASSVVDLSTQVGKPDQIECGW
jgi:hypothetical protein